jgi:glutathione S-transferase
MKLYSGPLSLYSRKVEIALAEKGLFDACEREMVPFNQQIGYQPKHPAVLAANPKGQVPVLVDGDLALFDSTLILEYLEEAYPSPPLLPPRAHPEGAAARARCRMLELYADDILFQLMRKLVHRSDMPPQDASARAAQIEAGKLAEAAIAHAFAKLDAQLAGKPFFCGDLSIADIGLFITILFIRRLMGPKLDPFPGLAQWHRRLLERPGFARAEAEIAAADRALTPALAVHAQLLGA